MSDLDALQHSTSAFCRTVLECGDMMDLPVSMQSQDATG